MIEIVVNGSSQCVPGDHTLMDLVSRLGLDPERIAIELDRKIVKRPLWAQTALHPGARLEIVQFVGGG